VRVKKAVSIPDEDPLFPCINACGRTNTASRLKKGFAACSKSCELAFRRECRPQDVDFLMRAHRDMAARMHGDRFRFVERGATEIKSARATITT